METTVGFGDNSLDVAGSFDFAGKGVQLDEIGRGALVEVVKAFCLFQRLLVIAGLIIVLKQGRQFVPVWLLFGDELVEIKDHPMDYE